MMILKGNQILVLLIVAMLMFCTNVYAVEVWYDFEEDSGRTAIDKLTTDGSQDGELLRNVSFQDTSGTVPWGTGSALFGLPVMEGNVIEVPGSDQLGQSFTLAMHVNNLEEALGFTRLFSSYGGTGGVPADRIIVDYDPTGTILSSGIRAIISGTSVTPTSMPVGLSDPGYHHYAVTAAYGEVRLYFDGSEIAMTSVAPGYSNTGACIRIGEDVNDLSAGASEQLVGNVDDILITDQVLTGAQIASLATGSSVQSVIGTPTGSYAVNYDFEGDSGTSITDKLVSDGAQDGIAINYVNVDSNAANAKLGNGSGALQQWENGASEIATGVSGTDLGEAFTLSAVINVDGDGYQNGHLARLFSSFYGSGSVAGQLVFDYEPDASTYGFSTRIILPNGVTVKSTQPFSYSENHTLTGVYDGSAIKIYIDGVEVASEAASGTVDLGDWELGIGEDGNGYANEQIVGTVDDVLILGRALSSTEVATLHTSGAAVLLNGNPNVPGDANKDGKVDGSDVTILAGNWQKGVSDGLTAQWEEGDFNGDGKVDGSDVTILAGNWQYGVEASAATVPEPSTLIVLLTLVSGFLCWRHR